MQNKIKPSRLRLYYSSLESFDNIDQNFRSNTTLANIDKNLIKNLSFNELTFLNSLVLEILTQQRFSIKNSKNKIRIVNLLSTVKKQQLFTILDIYLILTLIKEVKVCHFYHNRLSKKIHFFFRNQVSHNLNILSKV